MLDMRTHSNYLYRLAALFGIAELSQVCAFSLIKQQFMPVLKEMSKDAIPNIRMNVAKAAHNIRESIFNPAI